MYIQKHPLEWFEFTTVTAWGLDYCAETEALSSYYMVTLHTTELRLSTEQKTVPQTQKLWNLNILWQQRSQTTFIRTLRHGRTPVGSDGAPTEVSAHWAPPPSNSTVHEMSRCSLFTFASKQPDFLVIFHGGLEQQFSRLSEGLFTHFQSLHPTIFTGMCIFVC